MEFEKLQKIIAEVLNLSEEEIRPESKKSLTLRSIMKKRRK